MQTYPTPLISKFLCWQIVLEPIYENTLKCVSYWETLFLKWYWLIYSCDCVFSLSVLLCFSLLSTTSFPLFFSRLLNIPLLSFQCHSFLCFSCCFTMLKIMTHFYSLCSLLSCPVHQIPSLDFCPQIFRHLYE